MTKKTKAQEKRRLARMNKAIREKATELELEELEDELDEDFLNEEPEASRKSVDSFTSPAPTSFKELDDFRVMAEREEQIRKASYDVQDLVYNILHNSPQLTMPEKAEKIKRVGAEFGARVQNAVSRDETEMMRDEIEELDVLYVKALVAEDARSLGLVEKIGDVVSKMKLTARAEAALSDSDFAVVYEKDGVKVRKYPIHDKAHVRNALARAAQMIDEGGEAATDAKKALPKIREAAKKMGIGVSEKSSLVVEKGADGNWRAVMLPTNKYVDWHGDIISEAAHLEYAEWQNANMDVAPLFMTWHVPGTSREKPVDFVAYEDGFMIMSAPLTKDEAAGLLRVKAETAVGMSHTSLVFERDPDDPRVVLKYRTVEVTDLPLDAAANPFTSLDIISKEAVMETKDYLAKILGSDEKAEKFLERAGLKKKELDAAGIPSKEKGEEPPAAVPQDALTMEQVIERVSKEFGMEQLSAQFAELQEKAAKVDVLESLVKELAASKEEALAEMIAPPAKKSLAWMDARPSRKAETILKEGEAQDEELRQAAPKVGWLSEATKTTPIG